MAQAKSIRTEIAAQSPCTIVGCEEALNTMVSSVIENAIKYSDIDGRVRIGLHAAASGILLEIEDSGPGIPVGERERVFDRFYRRADSGASGSGLGLAIAREIAARHGASITLQASKSLGGLSACINFERTGAAARLDKALPRVA
jgi:signal transduction histidine kinase